MKKIGTIKAISPKEDGKNAFVLEENPGVWYNGFSLPASKGDKIEFEFDEKSAPFNNFSKVVVLEVATNPPSPPHPLSPENDVRLNVDAGNCVQRASELICAGKAISLLEATKEACEAFLEARRTLSTPTSE